jgi:hypothetical protein
MDDDQGMILDLKIVDNFVDEDIPTSEEHKTFFAGFLTYDEWLTQTIKMEDAQKDDDIDD